MKEFDLVRNNVELEGVPVGTEGTIVYVYNRISICGDNHYMVEFFINGTSEVIRVSGEDIELR